MLYYGSTKGISRAHCVARSQDFSLKIYRLTQNFPSSERFHIVDQMCRATTSAMANLAEGFAMATKKHRISYYIRARGSIIEVENFLELSKELHYITQEEYDDAVGHCARITYLITKLIQNSQASLPLLT